MTVQAISYGLDMGGFLLLIHMTPLEPVTANVFAKIGSGVFSFALHRYFTFSATEPGELRQQTMRYFLLLALNTQISSGILFLLLLGIPSSAMAKFLADVICVGLNFVLTKLWVFQIGRGLYVTTSKERR
jgi:putative flippase GtrA